jgi:hypothetical protein
MKNSHERTTWTPESRKQHNNRKRTKGRRIQTTACGKQVSHETINAISRKTALLNFFNRIEVLKSKWHKVHPEYQNKQKD